ncbi:putative Cell division coordinator CpoB [Hollandina sp. SP2]
MPEHPCYWSNRGISYYKKGDLDKALEDLNQSIALDPERSWALSYRGLVWKNKGDLDKALSDFTQALRYEPEDHWILDQRGYCWFIKEEYDQAIADFSAAIAIKPDDPELWLGRGVCYWNKKEEMDFEAITDFTKAIELAPDRAYAYYCRGGVYQFQAQEQIHITRGIIMERVKDEAQRLVLLGQLEQIGYKEFAPLFNRMLGTLRSNRTGAEDLLLKCANLIVEHSCEDAIQDFTQVIALEPENGDAFYQRGQCYAMGGEPGKAAADYEQACALDPGHVKAAEKLEYLLNRKQEAGSKQQVIGSKQQVSLFGIFYLLPAVSYLILVTQNKRIAIHPLPKRPLPEYCGKP